jgi:putative two-component system response regulator
MEFTTQGAQADDCEERLTALEREVRRRLSAEPWKSEDWFRGLGNTLLSSRDETALLRQVDILFHLVLWFEDGADTTFALKLGEHALALATKAGAHSSKRRALNLLGGVHLRAKNITEATVCFARAIEIANKMGDRMGQCAAFANLATARLTAGMIDDAMKLFRFVLDSCGDESMFNVLRKQAHHNLALSHLLLSDIHSAQRHMEMCAQYGQPSTQHELGQAVVMEFTSVKIRVAQGDLAAAEAHARSAAAMAAKAGNVTSRIHSQLALAFYECHHGCCDIALTRIAAIEPEVQPTDMAFPDLLEVKHLACRTAGNERDARHFDKKRLFSLAEYQRRFAIAQVAAAKRVLKRHEKSSLGFNPHRAERDSAGIDQKYFEQQLEAVAMLAELREGSKGEHSYRVGRLSALLALALGYEERDAAALEQAARLHDIGKLATPDAILYKRGKLSALEMEIVRRHTTEGCQILTDLLYTVEATDVAYAPDLAKQLRLAAEIAQHHHEWWDGSGYPRRVAGTLIPEAARIVSIADVFDELLQTRPYKPSFSKNESLLKIKELAGHQFEPRLCTAFAEVASDLVSLPDQKEEEISSFSAANRLTNKIIAREVH